MFQKIQPYDVVLFKGSSFIGKAIEFVTHSPYSHVGLALDDFHLAEAMNDGIDIDHLKDLPSGYDVYRYKKELTQEQKNKLQEFVYLKLSTKYNYEEIFSCLLEKEFGIDFPVVKHKLICSQFAYNAYLYAGIDLLSNFKGKIVTPADLSLSKDLIKVNNPYSIYR